MKIQTPIIAGLIAGATPVSAQEVQISPDRFAITLQRFETHPATEAEALQAVRRVEKAAMSVCGASSSSLRELQRAVRRSDCWRDAMADTRKQITDPMLLRVWEKRH